MALAEDVFSAQFWRRYMLETFLQYWQPRCLDRQHGGYLADFDRTWQFAGPGNKSLVSQARLIYNFSAGLRHTASAEWADAAGVGLHFLRQHMQDTDQGGWFWRCSRDGSVLEPVKHTYGHAFVIFGLSEYVRATGVTEVSRVALQTLQTLHDKAKGPEPLFWTTMDRQWHPLDRRRSQNPHMHLLEACLSLYDVTGSKLALETAFSIAELAEDRLVNRRYGCLEETFAEDWSLLPDEQADPIRVGHQFEWCWLLNRLADRTNDETWRPLGDRLLEWGLGYGTDRQHGGFYNATNRQGEPIDTGKSHWVESEALRALLYLIVARKREDLRPVFLRAAEFAFTHCADPEYGGWYSQVAADGAATHPNKGSEWKLDYHMTSLCDEAVRLLV